MKDCTLPSFGTFFEGKQKTDRYVMKATYTDKTTRGSRQTVFYWIKPFESLSDELKELIQSKSLSNGSFFHNMPTAYPVTYWVGSKRFVADIFDGIENCDPNVTYEPDLELDKETEDTFGDFVNEL